MFKERCYIKVLVKSNNDGYYGVIALAYSKDIELQPDIIHTGVLEKEKVYHFVINKSHMLVIYISFRVRIQRLLEYM